MRWTWFEQMPSTNVRIVVTLLLALATGARVVVTAYEPSIEWLGFLTAWAGIDVAQFYAKRATYQAP